MCGSAAGPKTFLFCEKEKSLDSKEKGPCSQSFSGKFPARRSAELVYALTRRYGGNFVEFVWLVFFLKRAWRVQPNQRRCRQNCGAGDAPAPALVWSHFVGAPKGSKNETAIKSVRHRRAIEHPGDNSSARAVVFLPTPESRPQFFL